MNWTIAEDIEVEPMYINSFGVIVKDTDEFLAIAQNYGNEPEQYSNITTIPKGCIKEVFVIHEDNTVKNEQKLTEWSKEDEKMLADACIMLDWYQGNNWWKAQHIKNWLKTLKQRIGG
jgi:hypothetical protein